MVCFVEDGTTRKGQGISVEIGKALGTNYGCSKAQEDVDGRCVPTLWSGELIETCSP